MARPRIFVSSTYYDLRHIRAVLESFIEQFGYEPVLFEKGKIPFIHTKTLEENCTDEVLGSDILILIIGGRYGSLSREDQELLKSDPEKFYEAARSVTRKEYEAARGKDIPIFIFVDENVLAEYRTYQENRGNLAIKYAHVDDTRIYNMIDDIFLQPRNNYIKGFSSHNEIMTWLREQWAGLFADALKRRQAESKLIGLEVQVRELANLVTSLKSYSEEIVRSVDKEKSKEIITKVNKAFRGRQLQDFVRHRLVEFIKVRMSTKLTTAELFNRFSDAKNFDDFVGQLDGDESMKSLLKNMNAARSDFAELKAQYE